jgi:hypothetical protein
MTGRPLISTPVYELFSNSSIYFRLVGVLRDFGRLDWQLASMVCQTLWNYSGRITSTNDCFGTEEAAKLTDLLTEYIGQYSALSSLFSSLLSSWFPLKYNGVAPLAMLYIT